MICDLESGPVPEEDAAFVERMYEHFGKWTNEFPTYPPNASDVKRLVNLIRRTAPGDADAAWAEGDSLRPCPFCGGDARRYEADDGGSAIECATCGASTALHYDRKENLRSSWNDRHGHAANAGGAVAAVERLRDEWKQHDASDGVWLARQQAADLILVALRSLPATPELAQPDRDAVKFIHDIMSYSWNRSSDIDGSWLQDEAAARGFIVEVKYDPEQHGFIEDVDAGDPVFVFAGAAR